MSTEPEKMDNDWRNGRKGMVPKLGYVLLNKKFFDVSFEIPNSDNGSEYEIVEAHKFILTVASPVFEVMFSGPFVESSQTFETPITIDNVDALGFKTMLNFIYTGELTKDLAPSTLVLTMIVANKYCISELAQECSSLLEKMIRTDTVVIINQIARICGEKELAEKTFTFLLRNFARVLEIPEFLNCTRELLLLVLKEDTIRVNNEPVIRWAKAECVRKSLDVSPQNQREMLGEIINLIRFPSMSVDDLSFKVIPTNILTSDETTLILQHDVLGSTFVHLQATNGLPKAVNIVKWNDPAIPIKGVLKDMFMSFNFTVDRRIGLVGCGFYGPVGKSKNLLVEMRVVKIVVPSEPNTVPAEQKVVLEHEQKNRQTKYAKKNQIFRVDFNSLVVIEPGIKHTIHYKMKGGSLTTAVGLDGVNKAVKLESEEIVNFMVDQGKHRIPEIRFLAL